MRLELIDQSDTLFNMECVCRVSACSADKQKCAGHVVIDARGTLTVLKSIDFDFYVRKEVYIVRVLLY